MSFTSDFTPRYASDFTPPKTSTEKNTPKRRGRRQKSVINPIFEEASKYIEDKFWEKMLEDAARGVFPNKTFTYNKGYLVCTIKKKNYSEYVSNNPEEAAIQFYNFIRKYSEFVSDIDRKGMDFAMTNNERIVKDVNNKELYPLLLRFIKDKSIELSLTPKQGKSLRDAICFAYYLNIINCKSVKIENGIITEVFVIEYDELKDQFKITDSALKLRSTEKQKDVGSSYHEMYTSRGKKSNKTWMNVSKYYSSIGTTEEEILII